MSAINARIWGITWYVYFQFFSFVLRQLGIEKYFCPYHVTYQPINIKKWLNVSLTPWWVIKAQKWRLLTKTLQMVPREKILTLCQFPDSPIDFCESRCIEALYIDAKKPTFWSKWKFREPVENGALRTFFEHLYWCTCKWRHVYDSPSNLMESRSSNGYLPFEKKWLTNPVRVSK